MENVHKALLSVQEEISDMEGRGRTDNARYFQLKKIEMDLQLALLQY